MPRRAGRVHPSPWPALTVAAVAAVACGGCATSGAMRSAGPVAFDTATVWVVQDADSASVRAEIARSSAQHEVGLAERASLDPGSGMLFLFPAPRSEEDGFWMWRTFVPLDIAFIDQAGTITQVLSMEPCEDQTADQDCPAYFPGAPYAAALEVNEGWFRRRGLGVGAVVRVAR